MADFVMIRHESQPESVEPAKTSVEAYEVVYKGKGWEVVGDAPADVNDPSLSVSEQHQLLETDPDALKEALAPSGSDEEAAATDKQAKATAASGRRGGSS